MAYIATHQGRSLRVEVRETAPNRFQVTLGDEQSGAREYAVDFLEPQPNLLSLIIDGRSFEVDVDAVAHGDRFDIAIEGDGYEVELVEENKRLLALKRGQGPSGRQDLRSPMAGNVRQVLVRPGDSVEAGQVLLILEAMKMENELKSPIQGTVQAVTAREGVAVAAGDPLCVLEPRLS